MAAPAIGPIRPDPAEFARLAKGKNRIPVWREVDWDVGTPLSAYLRVGGGDSSFLLESVEGSKKWARYSFIGVEPRQVIAVSMTDPGDPLAEIRRSLATARPARIEGLPRFWGGWVGMFGYDLARRFERLPATAAPGPDVPDLHLVETGTMLVHDHLRQTLLVLAVAVLEDDEDGTAPQAAHAAAAARVDRLVELLTGPDAATPAPPVAADPGDAGLGFQSCTAKPDFLRAVDRAKEHVRAGDVIQVVLSRRFDAPRGGADPLSVYRALRRLNPSPYLFLLRMGPDATLLGASPETLVRVEDGRIEVRPIAGTRPRGATPEEDRRLEAELLADPKERAEHLMLLDLGRNDVGRVSRPGSVEVVESFGVERYSHVMHLVSTVRGHLRDGITPLDVLAATFPAGTLSGAPKVRAMGIIEDLEGVRRGPYGGAVGYLSWDGNLDLCITIRSLLALGDTLHVQAGAGIVHDSVPELEYEETAHKAGALFAALGREGR